VTIVFSCFILEIISCCLVFWDGLFVFLVSELLCRRFVVRCSALIGSKVVMSNVGWVVPASLVVPAIVPPRATVAGGLTLVIGTESGSLLFWTLLALASWGFGLGLGTSSSKVVAHVG